MINISDTDILSFFEKDTGKTFDMFEKIIDDGIHRYVKIMAEKETSTMGGIRFSIYFFMDDEGGYREVIGGVTWFSDQDKTTYNISDYGRNYHYANRPEFLERMLTSPKTIPIREWCLWNLL